MFTKSAILTVALLSLLFSPFVHLQAPMSSELQQRCLSQGLQQTIDAMSPGDILILKPGVYCGPIAIRKPITMIGDGYPIIDGQFKGEVVLIEANDVTLIGLKLINSSPDISFEAAGVKVKGNNSRLLWNIITNVLFPIYLINTRNVLVENNTLESFSFKDIGERGHGVYLWYTFNTTIKGNYILNAKDGIYNEHAYETKISKNMITNSRYGIHLMYSANYSIEHNIISRNLVGSALMFSKNIIFSNNIVKENRGTAVSEGVFLKESGNVLIEQNVVYGHNHGLVIESSPYPREAYLIIRNNIVAFNYIGISIDSVSGGIVYGNNIIENIQQVTIIGASPPAVKWNHEGLGNFWSDYRGLGDAPHVVENPLEDIMDGFPKLRVFMYSPAYYALEAMKKAFPYNPRVKAIDERPLVKPSRSFDATFTGDPMWLLVALILTLAPSAPIAAAHRGALRWKP